jgi:6-phosphofructokinase 2
MKCSQPKLEPGGGGINVARAIKKLGGEAKAIYPAGGYTGMYFNKLLTQEGISSIIVESKNETRENIIILDETTNKQYRFGMPGSPLSEHEWKQVLKIIEEMDDVGYIVASGSLPPGVPTDIFARIARLAKNKNARLVVDSSGDALKYAVEEGVYLIKPNLRELSGLVGKDYLQDNEVGMYAKQLVMQKKTTGVMVSMGAKGAMLVTCDHEEMIVAPMVEKKSTVGAGDSLVAGMVLALSQGSNWENAARYGVACGTAATMNEGTELCRREDADRLFEQLTPMFTDMTNQKSF